MISSFLYENKFLDINCHHNNFHHFIDLQYYYLKTMQVYILLIDSPQIPSFLNRKTVYLNCFPLQPELSKKMLRTSVLLLSNISVEYTNARNLPKLYLQYFLYGNICCFGITIFLSNFCQNITLQLFTFKRIRALFMPLKQFKNE